MTRATVIDGARSAEVAATERGDTILVEPGDLERAIGWELKPEGLCREERCVLVHERGDLLVDGTIDLRGVARALGRPMAFEPGPPMAVIGDAAAERADAMAALAAPAFTLPDVDGRSVSLADFAGRKKLLLAWASW